MLPQVMLSASLAASLLLSATKATAGTTGARPRQLPKEPNGVQTITSPTNVTIRYKEPGKDGVCETTPGVNSYSGYVDLAADMHTFFWFFEARNNPSEAPLTLWLNGGPGSDSLIGLFQELGPCNISEDLQSELNPYAWNEESNMLFLSQPYGTGFSYQEAAPGTINVNNGDYEEPSFGGINGRYPIINATEVDTTDLAAVAAWHVLQGFLSNLPHLNSEIESKEFNLWTESYGGHYGPAFFNYFYEQNELIGNGTNEGVQLSMNTLGIINGIIDEYIQAPYYPEFAVHNTYGIKAVNDTVYNYMKFACFMENGCLQQVDICRQLNRTSQSDQAICSEAQSMCRDNVEGPYYEYSGRGVYDIRHPYDDPTPPEYFLEYLNQASIQNSLGVNLNYTQTANNEIYFAFQQTGDFVYPTFLEDLEMILDHGIRVALVYGDADYICNWFGGEAVSLQINYTNSEEFRAAGYTPFIVDGTEYGEVREYGNFSFTRMYEAGHEVPYYQPLASLEIFRRVINHLNLADGSTPITANYTTTGNANATHTESFVPLTTSGGGASSSSAAADLSETGKARLPV
ncbi:MAG: hypothetical protein M1837_002473 [Sclerophora amabilis]|nr:MAG: hypothetical protein M1837_002473 [Sclerophora amabilis]